MYIEIFITAKSLCYPGNSSYCIICSSSSCNNTSKWNPRKCRPIRIHVQIPRWVLFSDRKWPSISKWTHYRVASEWPATFDSRHFVTGHFQSVIVTLNLRVCWSIQWYYICINSILFGNSSCSFLFFIFCNFISTRNATKIWFGNTRHAKRKLFKIFTKMYGQWE